MLNDDAQTIARLKSFGEMLQWMSTMSNAQQNLMMLTIAEWDASKQAALSTMLDVLEETEFNPVQRKSALATIADLLQLEHNASRVQDNRSRSREHAALPFGVLMAAHRIFPLN